MIITPYPHVSKISMNISPFVSDIIYPASLPHHFFFKAFHPIKWIFALCFIHHPSRNSTMIFRDLLSIRMDLTDLFACRAFT